MKWLKSLLLIAICGCLLFSMTACGGEEEWEEVVVTKTSKVSTQASDDEGEVLGGDKTTTKADAVSRTEIKDQGFINSDKLTPQEEIFKEADLKDTTLTFVYGSEIKDYATDGSNKDRYTWKVLQEKWGIKLKHVVYSNSALPEMVSSLVASGNPPDLAHVSDVQLMRYAYTNLAQPLNDYLVKDDTIWDKGSCFDNFTFNGKIYGIGWHSQEDINYWIYYNKTLLKENNVEDPYELYKAGKWDTEAFKRVAIAATVKEADGTTVKIPGVACSQYMLFLAMYGESGITEQKGGKWKVTVDSTAGMQGLQMIYDLFQAKALVVQGGMQAKFGQRGSAMLIERPKNAMGNFDYYNTMKDEVGMVPMPKAPDGKYYGFTVCDGSFVFKGAKNPVAAIAYRYYCRLFERYTSDAEKIAAGYQPDNIINYSPEHLALAQDHLKKVDKILMSSMPALVNWGSGEELGAKFWKNLTTGGKQPAQLVDSVKSQILLCLKSTVGVGNVIG